VVRDILCHRAHQLRRNGVHNDTHERHLPNSRTFLQECSSRFPKVLVLRSTNWISAIRDVQNISWSAIVVPSDRAVKYGTLWTLVCFSADSPIQPESKSQATGVTEGVQPHEAISLRYRHETYCSVRQRQLHGVWIPILAVQMVRTLS